jgi:hypothetical protein
VALGVLVVLEDQWVLELLGALVALEIQWVLELQ